MKHVELRNEWEYNGILLEIIDEAEILDADCMVSLSEDLQRGEVNVKVSGITKNENAKLHISLTDLNG